MQDSNGNGIFSFLVLSYKQPPEYICRASKLSGEGWFVCHGIQAIIPNANRNARVSQKAKTVPPMFVRLLWIR